MTEKLMTSGHAVGESNYHIVLTPAYRQDIFREHLIQELTIAYIATKLKEFKVHLLAFDFGPDHLHLFVSNVRFIGEIELIRQLKGYSSYMMRKGHSTLFAHKLWGDKFWSYGHFYRSVGAVNKETVRHYVEESQSKHWKTAIPQQTLLGFCS